MFDHARERVKEPGRWGRNGRDIEGNKWRSRSQSGVQVCVLLSQRPRENPELTKSKESTGSTLRVYILRSVGQGTAHGPSTGLKIGGQARAKGETYTNKGKWVSNQGKGHDVVWE